jgi:cysteine desulfurase
MKIYLDNAATTPISPEVLEAMMPFLQDSFGNPSSQHSYGRENRAAVEQARKAVAGHFSASAGEIIFTSGGTEATNLALISAARDMGVRRIVTSPVEHHCVLHTAEYLAREYGAAITYLPVDRTGKVDPGDLDALLQGIPGGEKVLVSVMHANNETGVMNDIERLGAICREYGALFHSDTVQTVAHFRIDTSALAIDFMTGSAHKFHGPKGIGFLYARKGLSLQPLIFGGGQERGKRSGTENIYGIAGMSKALDMAYGCLEEERAYIKGLKIHMLQKLRENFDDVLVNGTEDMDHSLYTVLNVSFPPDDRGALLLFNLDMEGVCVSGGSACNSGASKGSHVLEATGADQDRISIRFSFSKYNTAEEIDFAVERLQKVFHAGAAL